MDDLRFKINSIDNSLLHLIKERMQTSIEIGKYKKNNNLPIYDEKREKELLEKLNNENKKSNIILEEKFINDFWNNIMSYSKKLQE